MRSLRAVFVVLLLAASLSTAAQAAATCSLEGTTLVVGLDERDDPYVLSRSVAGEVQLDSAACGGANVTGIDIIEVEESAQVGDQILVVDLANGGFAPGASPEATGLPEIELDVNLGNPRGSSDALIIAGGDAEDTVVIGAEAIALNGDDDSDVSVVQFLDQRFVVRGGGGADSVSAAGGNGTGDIYPNSIEVEGGDGNDTLTGGMGTDTLSGDAGADLIDGGADACACRPYDIARYTASPAAVTVDLAAGVGTGGHAQGDVLVGIDSLEGSEFDDVLTGDNGGNGFNGKEGNDVLIGAGGDDQLEGGAGADSITGGDGNDEIQHFGSPEAIQADLGAQTVTGGHATGDTISGIEKVVGSDFDDTLVGSAADDWLSGYFGNDSIQGLAGNDSLNPGPDNDNAQGGEGNDYFYAGSTGDGTDVLDGGPGDEDYADYDGRHVPLELSLDGIANDGEPGENDNIIGIEGIGSCHGGDALSGSLSRDMIKANGGDDDVAALGGPDFIIGGDGSDDVTGSGGDDKLLGNSGGDELSGGKGSDTLNGGPGADILNGGPGQDICVVDSKDVQVKSCEVKRNNQRRGGRALMARTHS